MISVFDIYKIGIGPSSSHTVGPMRAATEFLKAADKEVGLSNATSIQVELFGSLGQTGKGHGTGKAVILGLAAKILKPLIPPRLTSFWLPLTSRKSLNFWVNTK